MTVAHFSSSPAAQGNSQHDELLQRLDAIALRSTASRTSAHRLSGKTASPPNEEEEEQDVSHSTTTSRVPSHRPAKQTGTLLEDSESMVETDTLARQLSNTSDDSMSSRQPSTPRSQTDPAPGSTFTYHHTQPHNRSPYARSHLRSQSGHSALAPPMTRAHSLPIVMQTTGGIQQATGRLTLSPSPMPLDRPSSPLRSPKPRSPRTVEPRLSTTGMQERYGSGIRPASVGSFEGAPSVCDIAEDAELELTPRASSSMSSLYSSTGSLSRRRRPASPLYHVAIPFGAPPTSTPSVSTPTSAASSPMLAPSKFNEHYPSSFASSSVPSTPTSMRSRSPSISSLETIEDSPDAEDLALEAERIAQLKAAADREDGGEPRRSSLDVPEGRGRSFNFGKRDSRKRWSVCGGERRVDLSLGTVWED
ncbi:hypothetical protein BU25DRAFT_410117 [Macroventuria anomochaeta]|uniref:Uncharacterized protein n=1 Tax=Macroventuria anomochaeta TaxID=301207 RepID=A0ACB6S335_9PLEO|nr:uncharacterized protein BU25DRAFT_410117 [Macroventuria anomochaeta]KAF2628556.1 hypothetical protein BU25DRAFT_410117 [Macroventuria anomochaeta]